MLELLIGTLTIVSSFSYFTYKKKHPGSILKKPLKKVKHPGYDNREKFYRLMMDVALEDMHNSGKPMEQVRSLRDFLPPNVSPLQLSHSNLQYIEKAYEKSYAYYTKNMEKVAITDDLHELESERSAYHDALKQLERKELH